MIQRDRDRGERANEVVVTDRQFESANDRTPKARYGLAVLLALSVHACTYGPAQRRTQIDGALVRPETRTIAATVRSEVRRDPTGVSTFPDGGRAKISDQSVTIYFADADAQTVRRVGQLAAPAEVRTSFSTTMLGWRGTSLFLVLTGCPGSECYGSLTRRLTYRVDENGAIARIDSLPPNLEHAPGSIARAPGERMYMRVSRTTDSISMVTDDGGPWLPRFALDRNGDLAPVPRAP
jgi:hypothetical protein